MQNGNGTAPAVEDTEHTNGNGASQEEKFSDSEDEEEQQQQEEEHVQEFDAEPFIPPSAPVPVPDPIVSTPEPLTVIRKRLGDRPPSSLSALPLVDRQVSSDRLKSSFKNEKLNVFSFNKGTPTPRPSIHSFSGSGSSQYTYESRRLLDTTDSSSVKPLPAQAGASPIKPKLIRYVVLLLIVLATAYIIYTVRDSKKTLTNMTSTLINE